MDTTHALPSKTQITVPVIALFLYAISSGYAMSLIPLMLNEYGLANSLASWLACTFYAGLLLGSLMIESLVVRLGHKNVFIGSLAIFMLSMLVLPALPYGAVWLVARFIAGIVVAGIFVTVESWLLDGEAEGRAKRVGLYMISLYGGSALGQTGIGLFGIEGLMPFIMISSLIALAIVVLVFAQAQQPASEDAKALSLKQILKLSHAAIIGCIVSGLTLGAIYGLMPLELANRLIDNSEVGTLMAMIILGGMVVQFMVPWLSKVFGRTLLMALFCILGAGAIGVISLFDGNLVLAASLFVLGMATFAIYPIAISLGCDGLDSAYIVSATQFMLFSYSIGSVAGPLIADGFMTSPQGLMRYLFVFLLATSLYMFVMSIRAQRRVMAK